MRPIQHAVILQLAEFPAVPAELGPVERPVAPVQIGLAQKPDEVAKPEAFLLRIGTVQAVRLLARSKLPDPQRRIRLLAQERPFRLDSLQVFVVSPDALNTERIGVR